MRPSLSFKQLEAFRAVVLTGTTVAAARMLNTTQPSVSRLVRQAQTATGLQLFITDHGRLRLTREGHQLYQAVHLHFRGIEQVALTAAALRTSGAGVFSIACTPAPAQALIPKALKDIHETWPNAQLNLHTLSSANIQDGLRQGLYDVAITHTHRGKDEFPYREVHVSNGVFICAHEHPLAAKEVVHAQDLANELLIALPAEDPHTYMTLEAMSQAGAPVPQMIETSFSATICALVAQNIGIAVVNRYIAEEFADRLCMRPFTPQIRVPTLALFSRFTPPSEIAEWFVGRLTSVMAEYREPGNRELERGVQAKRYRGGSPRP